ncbi:MAG: hypothetical protein U0457_16780 [Candidatus Sericytochromatia bacterium]
MKKLLLLSLVSAFVFSCNNQNMSNLNIDQTQISNVSTEVDYSFKLSDKLPTTTKVKTSGISENLKKSTNKTEATANTLLKYKKKTDISLKSTQGQIDALKKALADMEKSYLYDESVEIGRKAVITLAKQLIDTNDKDFDAKNILNNALVLARVQEQEPKNYDDDSVKAEYALLITALKGIIEMGPSTGGNPKNLAIFALNAKKVIENVTDIEKPESKLRDTLYLGALCLTLYSKEKDYEQYADLAKKTLEELKTIKDLKEAQAKVFKSIDSILN